LTLSVWLLDRQPGAASAREVAEWYGQRRNRAAVLVGLNLAPFSGIAPLWFIAVLTAAIMVSAAAGGAPVLVMQATGDAPSGDVVALSEALWRGVFTVVASRFAAVFMITTSTLGLRFRAFPRWLSRLGYVMAVVLFVTGAFAGPYGLLFAVWVFTVSITLFAWRRRLTDETAAPAKPRGWRQARGSAH